MDRLNRLNRVVNEVAEERAQRFAGRDLEVGSQLHQVGRRQALHLFPYAHCCCCACL